MTREEEMWKAVEEEHGVLSMREAFVTLTATKWADKTMLDKVCDWLLNNADSYVMMKGCSCYYNNIGLVNDLRKAMEEEV